MLTLFQQNQAPQKVNYRIRSIMVDNHKNKVVRVKIRQSGKHISTIKPLQELLKSPWLDQFSKADKVYLEALSCAEQEGDFALIEQLSHRSTRVTPSVLLIGMLFISFLIISNVASFKLLDVNLTQLPFIGSFLFDFHADAGILFFPIVYIFSDILTEVYGFRVSRLVIWSGLLCLIITSLGLTLAVWVPPSKLWHHQEAYELTLGSTFRIFIASLCGYFVGEFLNAIILSQLKVFHRGKYLWIRVIASTSLASLVDAIIFCFVAFYGIYSLPLIENMITFSALVKLIWGIASVPITYMVCAHLKHKDNVNAYDWEMGLLKIHGAAVRKKAKLEAEASGA